MNLGGAVSCMDVQNKDNSTSETRFCWAVILTVALVCAAAYVNTLPGTWVWDDVSSVLMHKHVQDPGQFFQLFREDQHAFGRGQGNFYRPLVSASFMLDYRLSGGARPDADGKGSISEISPFLFHVTNMLLHLVAALLFWYLLHGIGAPRLVQIFAPLIFVAHPLHTEAVAYISGRADMMSAAAVFGALCFVNYSFHPGKSISGLVGAGVCFVVGLLSKESSLIYPVLLLALLPVMQEKASSQDGGTRPSRLQVALPALMAGAILGIYVVLRATLLRFGEDTASSPPPLLQRLFEAMQALGLYLKLLFFPVNLHMERVLDTTSRGYAVLGIVFLLLLLAGIVLGWRRGNRRIAAGFAWFLAAWLPISGIFPLNAPMAEHWMYVPMAGFWWGTLELACVLFGSQRIKTIFSLAAVALILIFTGMTVRRNLDWRDNATLFRSTLAQNPNSARAHFNLAVTYEDLEHNYAGARRHYECYLELQAMRRAKSSEKQLFIPDEEIEARMALGRVLMRLKEYEDAVNTFAPLILLAETEAWKTAAAFAAYKTGEALLALGEITQSNAYFNRAMQLDSNLMNDIENTLSGKPFYDGY